MDEEAGREAEMFEILPYEARPPSGILLMVHGKTDLYWS
jgi:hypothetical protein